MNVYKVRPLLLASMRPPEFTGGNGVVKTTVGTINFGASMRPPEFTGGNLADADDLRYAVHVVLQ